MEYHCPECYFVYDFKEESTAKKECMYGHKMKPGRKIKKKRRKKKDG